MRFALRQALLLLVASLNAGLASKQLCRSANAVDAKITFEFAQVVQNNLGGLGSVLGPVSVEAPFLRFDHVGSAEGLGSINMIIENKTLYQSTKVLACQHEQRVPLHEQRVPLHRLLAVLVLQPCCTHYPCAAAGPQRHLHQGGRAELVCTN